MQKRHPDEVRVKSSIDEEEGVNKTWSDEGVESCETSTRRYNLIHLICVIFWTEWTQPAPPRRTNFNPIEVWWHVEEENKNINLDVIWIGAVLAERNVVMLPKQTKEVCCLLLGEASWRERWQMNGGITTPSSTSTDDKREHVGWTHFISSWWSKWGEARNACWNTGGLQTHSFQWKQAVLGCSQDACNSQCAEAKEVQLICVSTGKGMWLFTRWGSNQISQPSNRLNIVDASGQSFGQASGRPLVLDITSMM